MVEQEVMFYAPDEENLRILEDMNLTYVQMTRHYKTKQSRKNICKLFHKYGIHHKTKTELIKNYLKDEPYRSTQFIAIKFGVSQRLVAMVKATLPRRTYVKYWYEDSNFNCIISGHSGYDVSGKDIVCSSISSISIFFVNYMSECVEDVSCKSYSGYLEFTVPIKADYQQVCVDCLIEHINELKRQFPNYIEVL